VSDTHDGVSVLVEIGLVHDGTGDKWRAKLDWDMEKLRRPLPAKVSSLQIIVLVSTSAIRAADDWDRWLARLNCWSRRNCAELVTALPPAGEMVIRGWA
jgi:hypothetical protein